MWYSKALYPTSSPEKKRVECASSSPSLSLLSQLLCTETREHAIVIASYPALQIYSKSLGRFAIRGRRSLSLPALFRRRKKPHENAFRCHGEFRWNYEFA